MTKFDNLIDRIKLAGRRTAESWLGSVAPDQGAHEARVRAMTACLSSVIVTPLFSAPVLLMTFSWPLAVAGALAVAAASMAIAGLLAATGSLVMTARASLAIAGVALGVLAVCSGGLASPFLPLLVLLPLESAIRSSRLSGFGQGLLTSLATSAAVLAADAAGLAFAMPQGAFAAAALALALYVMARGLASALSAPSLEPQTAVVESKPAPVVDEASILDQLPGLVTLHDPHGGVHRVAGADHAGFTGRIGNLAGKGFVSRIHVADRIAFLDALDALRRGEPRSHVELRFETTGAPSQFVHASISLSAQCDADGCLTGVLAQTRDISAEVTDRFRAHAVVEQAESANASKTRFLAAVSHELRTPLNAIIGFSDILAREMFGKFSDERQREYVGLIHQSGQHLLSLVNTMLDMSKIEAGRYEVFVEPFQIAEAIDNCDAMLRLQASTRGVTLTRRLARGTGEVVADRSAVNQILINLVGNAIKFTERGGVVNVDAACRDGQLELVVSDTGIGIPADKLATIGEPFVQAQGELCRHYEGTGLGLSLVKGLVDLHGGTFGIESTEGEGTVVTVTLPVDGSGANPHQQPGSTDAAVVFPPELPRHSRKAASILARTVEITRNEDYAETARIA